MRKDLPAYIALGVVCLIWGTTYLALRIAVTHFPPFLFIAIRQVIAGGALIGFVFLTGKGEWPDKANLIRQAIAGFFMISLGQGLVAWAEMHIPSGVAAVICSLMPMQVVLVNLLVNREEKPTLPIIVGVIIGLSGIMMIFGEQGNEFWRPEYLTGIALTFLGVLSWACCSVWLKKGQSQSGTFVNAGLQLFFGGLWLVPTSLLLDDLGSVTWSSEVLYSLIYLIVFGSIIAFGCYTYALRKLPITIVSLYAYINPIVAVILGWVVLDETLTAKIGAAIFITVGGIYIVNRGYQLRDFWKAQFSIKR